MKTLDELERFERKATKGPWRASIYSSNGQTEWHHIGPIASSENNAKVDAEFISALRNAAPALLAVARAAALMHETFPEDSTDNLKEALQALGELADE